MTAGKEAVPGGPEERCGGYRAMPRKLEGLIQDGVGGKMTAQSQSGSLEET